MIRNVTSLDNNEYHVKLSLAQLLRSAHCKFVSDALYRSQARIKIHRQGQMILAKLLETMCMFSGRIKALKALTLVTFVLQLCGDADVRT